MNKLPALFEGNQNLVFSQIMENNPSSVIVTDLNGDIVYVNPHFSCISGYKLEEVLGKNPRILKSDKNVEDSYSEMWSLILHGKSWKGELCNKKKNGELFWVFCAIFGLFNDSGVLTHLISIQNDITKRKNAEERTDKIIAVLIESEKAAQVGGWEIDLKTRQQTWTEGTYRILETEIPGGELEPPKRIHFVESELKDSATEALRDLITLGKPFDLELQVKTAKGNIRWVHMTGKAFWENQTIARVGGAIQNITERKEAMEALKISEANYKRLCYIDGMTRIFNRKHFDEEIKKEIERAVRYPSQPFTMVMFDIDFFKNVNDTYGHIAGDQVLERFGQVLTQGVRTTDMAHRYGGEEFTCMLQGVGLREGRIVAEKIRQKFNQQSFSLPDGRSFGKLTLSAGVAQYDVNAREDNTGETIHDFLARLDARLYDAKRTGRDKVCF